MACARAWPYANGSTLAEKGPLGRAPGSWRWARRRAMKRPRSASDHVRQVRRSAGGIASAVLERRMASISASVRGWAGRKQPFAAWGFSRLGEGRSVRPRHSKRLRMAEELRPLFRPTSARLRPPVM